MKSCGRFLRTMAWGWKVLLWAVWFNVSSGGSEMSLDASTLGDVVEKQCSAMEAASNHTLRCLQLLVCVCALCVSRESGRGRERKRERHAGRIQLKAGGMSERTEWRPGACSYKIVTMPRCICSYSKVYEYRNMPRGIWFYVLMALHLC